MRVRRGLLFWGLVLIPLGAIPLLVRAGALDADRLSEVWRLWPVALILVGLAVLAGRRQVGLVAVAAAALTVGGLGGSVIASGQWIGPVGVCIGSSEEMETMSADGATEGGIEAVTLDLDCGSLSLMAAPGDAWRVDARYLGPAPDITSTTSSVRVAEPGDDLRHRQDWTVVVPDRIGTIELEANAAASDLALGRAEVGRLTMTVNAGDLTVHAGEAALDRLDIDLNAGRARITLGDTPTVGTLSVNAGALELCVPAGAGLQLDVEEQLTFAHDLDTKGLDRAGDRWTRPAEGGGATIELVIEGNAASLTLDPEEGCR